MHSVFEEDDVRQIHDIFVRFDANESGTVSAAELKHFLREFGVFWSDRQARAVVAAAKADDGELSFAHFLLLFVFFDEREPPADLARPWADAEPTYKVDYLMRVLFMPLYVVAVLILVALHGTSYYAHDRVL